MQIKENEQARRIFQHKFYLEEIITLYDVFDCAHFVIISSSYLRSRGGTNQCQIKAQCCKRRNNYIAFTRT